MPIALIIMMTLAGLTYIVFAFINPPGFLQHFYRVPAIFIFLPDRYVVPVGRFFAGLMILGVTIFLTIKVPPEW